MEANQERMKVYQIQIQVQMDQERMKSLPAAAAGRSCWSTFVKPAAFTSRTAGAHRVSLAHSNNRDYRRGFEL